MEALDAAADARHRSNIRTKSENAILKDDIKMVSNPPRPTTA